MESTATMTGLVHAMVLLRLALPAVTACGTARPQRSAMRGSESEIRFERNSESSGPRSRVYLALKDGREGPVSTADDAIATRAGETPAPGHVALNWTFPKAASTGTTLAHALVSWSPGEPADCLLGGWRIRFPGRHLPEPSLADSGQYAIVDGPEIDPSNPPPLPPAGEAACTGSVGGACCHVPEGNRDAVVEAGRETITLGTDFGSRTPNDCTDWVGEVSAGRAHFGAVLVDEVPNGPSPIADYELHFGAAAIGANGSFDAAGIAVRHPGRTQVIAECFWGAAANIQNGDGGPRLGAGFSSIVVAARDGSRAVIVTPGARMQVAAVEGGPEARCAVDKAWLKTPTATGDKARVGVEIEYRTPGTDASTLFQFGLTTRDAFQPGAQLGDKLEATKRGAPSPGSSRSRTGRSVRSTAPGPPVHRGALLVCG